MQSTGNLLLWGSGSAPCWRLMIVLAEKQVPYESRLLSFDRNEHRSQLVASLNPRRELPTFRHGDIVINQSVAACEFIEELYRDVGEPLMPTDLRDKARVLQRKHEFVSSTCLTRDLYFLINYYNEPRTKDQDREYIAAVDAELPHWESHVKEGYVAGDKFTLADAVFFPSLAFLVRIGLQLESRFSGLSAYHNRVMARASVQATLPPHWREGPSGLRLFDVKE